MPPDFVTRSECRSEHKALRASDDNNYAPDYYCRTNPYRLPIRPRGGSGIRLGFGSGLGILLVRTFVGALSFRWPSKPIPYHPPCFYLLFRPIMWLALPVTVVQPLAKIRVIMAPPFVLARREKTSRICAVHRIVVYISVKIHAPSYEPKRVFIDEPSCRRIVVSRAIRIEARLRIDFASSVLEAIRYGAARRGQVAERVVPVVVSQSACRRSE